MEPSQKRLEWAFTLVLVGGVLVAAGGFANALMLSVMMPTSWMPGTHMGAADWADGWMTSMATWLGLWGIGAGLLVIAIAFQLRRHPAQAGTWGVAAVAGGIIALFALGGYVVGSLLAIMGGVLAISVERERGQDAHGSRPDA